MQFWGNGMMECWGATNPLEVVDCKETLQG